MRNRHHSDNLGQSTRNIHPLSHKYSSHHHVLVMIYMQIQRTVRMMSRNDVKRTRRRDSPCAAVASLVEWARSSRIHCRSRSSSALCIALTHSFSFRSNLLTSATVYAIETMAKKGEETRHTSHMLCHKPCHTAEAISTIPCPSTYMIPHTAFYSIHSSLMSSHLPPTSLGGAMSHRLHKRRQRLVLQLK